jgi:polyisoprenyl-teichoic acid--peptidoglycan teichoic acid transferase
MRKPPSRHPAGRTAWWVAATLVGALLLTVASVAAVNAWNVGAGVNSQFQTIPDALPAPGAKPGPSGSSAPDRAGSAAATEDRDQNILVLGVDGGDGRSSSGTTAPGGVLALLTADALRAATVVHVPADRRSVTVVGVPLSDAAGSATTGSATTGSGTAGAGIGDATIRSALAVGGVPGAVRAAETLVAMHIDRVAAVDLAGFAEATTALGGVTVDNPSTFSSGGRTFPAGRVHLDGISALDWVRGPDAGGLGGGHGIARAEIQQLLLQAMLTTAVRAETLTNLRTLSELGRRLSPFVAVDAGLTSAYLVDLGLELRDIRSDVVFLTLPATDAARREVLTATFGDSG